MSNDWTTIRNFAGAYFYENKCTPETMDTFISVTDGFITAWAEREDVSKEELVDEIREDLEQRHSVTVNIDGVGILEDGTGHQQWFNADTNAGLEREIEWHCWDHYQKYLTQGKGWPPETVRSLDKFSSMILQRLEDPERNGAWQRRGMVVGNVQSGKTANYTGLITKAIDAGYKFIVVLTGIHESLRVQTQKRINLELIGYDYTQVKKISVDEVADTDKRIGVRKMFRDHRIIQSLTSDAPKGDFNRIAAQNATVIPSQTGDPFVLIIKKNVSILKNLLAYLENFADSDEDGRKIMNVPFLMIDDECDYASVNTRKEEPVLGEETDPTQTNMRIRQLLSIFPRHNYIGYTATPFANIFIHKDDSHKKYGDDLFPRHFIINLPAPSDYVGPERLFGIEREESADDDTSGLPLIVEVDDNEKVIPSKHKKTLIIEEFPESLNEALKNFILVCAARKIREHDIPHHNSMLIHVTRFINVQGQIKEQVESKLKELTARLQNKSDPLEDFEEIWSNKFIPVSKIMMEEFSDAKLHQWSEIKTELYKAAAKIKVLGINGEIKDILQYDFKENSSGVSIIAVGGDKLSRGLTLDGLSVSYYLRASRMYDTLMQMGRWFGYRRGYNDLCRIYMTDELREWYTHIAGATKTLKQEFDYMVDNNKTPEDFGLKVKSHPGQLVITAAGKMRKTQTFDTTFSGSLQQTTFFNQEHSTGNLSAVESLISEMKTEPEKRKDDKGNYIWRDISVRPVINFLGNYKTHKSCDYVCDPEKHIEYIDKMNNKGELTDWTISVISLKTRSERSVTLCGKHEVTMPERSASKKVTDTTIDIKALHAPEDEFLDFTQEEFKEYKEYKEKNQDNTEKFSRWMRGKRPATRGVLLIYIIFNKNRKSKNDETKTAYPYGMESGTEVTGYVLSLPDSQHAGTVSWTSNSVYQTEQLEMDYDA